MDTVKKLLRFLLTATMMAAAMFIISNTYGILTADFTSFPWWSALVFAAIYFGPVLALEGIAWLVICFLRKRKE